MKVNCLALLAGAGGSLFFAGAADADYTGLSWTITSTAQGVVWRIFANFDNTADHLTAVAGTVNSPMAITTTGTFYQNAFSNDNAPNPALFGPFPSVANDTFVTIGAATSTDFGGDQTGLSPGWPGFGASSIGGTNIAWFITPDDPQGSAANGPVLIGQFTQVFSPGPAGTVEGLFFNALLQYEENGVPDQSYELIFPIWPAPGVLALFGVAGVVGRSRRRRYSPDSRSKYSSEYIRSAAPRSGTFS